MSVCAEAMENGPAYSTRSSTFSQELINLEHTIDRIARGAGGASHADTRLAPSAQSRPVREAELGATNQPSTDVDEGEEAGSESDVLAASSRPSLLQVY